MIKVGRSGIDVFTYVCIYVFMSSCLYDNIYSIMYIVIVYCILYIV